MTILTVSKQSPDGHIFDTTGSPRNTTGYKFLAAIISDSDESGVFSDSKSNTWTLADSAILFGPGLRIYYCESPTVGTGHTFQLSGDVAGAISIIASTDQFTIDTGKINHNTNASGLNVQPGSVTPSGNGSLILAGCAYSCGDTMTCNLGTTDAVFPLVGGAGFGLCAAHLVQSTAGAINPTFAVPTNVSEMAAVIAVFAPSGSATLETLDGPASGFVGHQSSDFTVGSDGDLSGVTTTPTTDGTGVFIPSSLMGAGTFKYVSLTAETCNINCSNDGGLTPPDDIAFTSTVGTPSGGGRLVNGGLVS